MGDRRMPKYCPFNCYGNGNCPVRLEPYSSNITVASCECLEEFSGHLCNCIPEPTLANVVTNTLQWISLSLVVLAAVVFFAYAGYNRMLNSQFEYSQIRRITSTWEDEDNLNDILDD